MSAGFSFRVRKTQMPRAPFVLLVAVTLALVALAGFSFVQLSAAGDSRSSSAQFVTYQVSVSSFSFSSWSAQKSVVVNESVFSPPSSHSGFDILTLQLISSMSNLTYSRVVNSSEVQFPYLPSSMGNQNFSYNNSTNSMEAHLTKVGTSSVNFKGSSNPANVYDFDISGVANRSDFSANGNLTTLPSGIVYSVAADLNNSTTVQVLLLDTNLPLSAGAQSSAQTATATVAVSSGLGAIVAGVGAFFFVRRERKGKAAASASGEQEKPLHWVD